MPYKPAASLTPEIVPLMVRPTFLAIAYVNACDFFAVVHDYVCGCVTRGGRKIRRCIAAVGVGDAEKT